MPCYIGGIAASGGQTMGWTTTTSSTTTSCMNPFYGAMGGTTSATTTTSGWNECQTIWIETVATGSGLPYQDPSLQQQMMLAQYQQCQQEMMSAHQWADRVEEDRANALYEARYRAQLAEQQARTNEERAALAERERARLDALCAARERARELLIGTLSPEQRETFTKNGWFIVEGGKSKKKYRIQSRGYQGNIDVLDARNNVQYRLCVHCAHDLPLEDHLLSQKTMLELAEDDIIKLANRHAA